MATFTITTTEDRGAGSLRQAVVDANASAGADVIVFDADVFDGEAEDLIRLTSGQIEIADELTIVGGPAGATITGDANGDDVVGADGITDVEASVASDDRLDDNSRIFDATAALTLDGLTLTGGRTMADFESGGAVRGRTTVTLIDSTVRGNSTAEDYSGGGGVFGFDVTLTNSTVSGNSTAGGSSVGGGVSGYGVTLTNSTVSGNSTAENGSEGGGVSGYRVFLTNSTVSGNSTAGDNSGGGGVWGFDVTLTNSIVLGNATIFAEVDGDEVGSAVEGDLTLTGGNIVGGDLFDGDANVGDAAGEEVFAATTEIAPGVLAGVLADNGGPTRTILIEADGPAVDAGGATALPIDQRGLERVFGAAVDLGAVELGAGPAEPGSLVVTTALDVVANDGLTSLREAVFFANFELGTDTIAFDASVFDGEAGDVIRLTGGQIGITEALTIEGGAAGVTITGDANGDDVTLAGGITDVAASGDALLDDNSRIFDARTALTLDGLTLTGGRTMADLAGGGAVRGVAVTLRNSTVSGNSTAGDNSGGGGVSGTYVTLTNSTVSGNSTTGDNSDGGGVWGFNVTLTNSTVSGNSTAGNGSEGGGVGGGDVTLTNSTVSGNSTAGAYSGGGGVWGNNVTLTNSIVLGNATIFAEVNGDEVGIDGAVTRTGGNIVGGNLFDGDADVGDVTAAEVFAATTEIAPGVLAGVLADNGGPTRTILIEAGGPAVDAGGAATLRIDQRGLERVFGAAVDLGAVELGAGPAEPVSLVVTTALDVVANDGLTSLREAVFFANFELGTDTIAFDASVFDGEAGDVIRLTGGQIGITEALTIEGGAAGVTITGDAYGDDVTLAGGITDVAASGGARLDDNSRIFDARTALTLDGLTLTGGRTMADLAGGGAVRGSTITLTNSTVSGNSTAGNQSDGGGVFGGDITLTNSTVSGNSTAGNYSDGGGVRGLYVTLTNSTVSGNSTAGDISEGGGVYGGGSSVYGGYGGVTLANSIVLGNATIFAGVDGDEVEVGIDGAALTRTGGNIIGGDLFDGEADVGDVTPAEVFAATAEIAPGVLAGVLADNGGSTRTIAIRADGPAAGAADPASATATDQRGFARDADPDLGAFEAAASGEGLTLVGGPQRDVLTGSAFDDQIYGRRGSDVLRGLAGDDLIRGDQGCDAIKGGDGADDLAGGKGRDRIDGGLGDDLMQGGGCPDRFVFVAGFGADVIEDFDADPQRGQDRLDLRGLGVTAETFAARVAIERLGEDTLITVLDHGSILCLGVPGEGANAIDQIDLLLVA